MITHGKALDIAADLFVAHFGISTSLAIKDYLGSYSEITPKQYTVVFTDKVQGFELCRVHIEKDSGEALLVAPNI